MRNFADVSKCLSVTKTNGKNSGINFKCRAKKFEKMKEKKAGI